MHSKERMYTVDSGASFHVMGLSSLNREEKKTIRQPRKILDIQTFNGIAVSDTQAKVYIRELGACLWTHLMKHSPSVAPCEFLRVPLQIVIICQYHEVIAVVKQFDVFVRVSAQTLVELSNLESHIGQRVHDFCREVRRRAPVPYVRLSNSPHQPGLIRSGGTSTCTGLLDGGWKCALLMSRNMNLFIFTYLFSVIITLLKSRTASTPCVLASLVVNRKRRVHLHLCSCKIRTGFAV